MFHESCDAREIFLLTVVAREARLTVMLHKQMENKAVTRVATELTGLKTQVIFVCFGNLKFCDVKQYFWFKYDLRQKYKFDPIGVRTHNLQIMIVHFMSLRHLL